MSHPYVIWTLRRTGGTTLTALINSLSEYPTIDHEPFNPDRAFGPIAEAFKVHGDVLKLRKDLDVALQPRPLIKHCFELVSADLNTCLMEVSTQLGYRHIFLDRHAELDRILSLELAKLTGVWGKGGAAACYDQIEAGTVALDPIDIPAAIAHRDLCASRRADITAQLAQLDEPTFKIFFEDIYADPTLGRNQVERLLDFLDLKIDTIPDFGTKLANALATKSQNSARVIDHVPNVTEARAALRAATVEPATRILTS